VFFKAWTPLVSFEALMKVRYEGCVIWKEILNGLKDGAAALFVHGRRDRSGMLSCVRESRRVINYHRWFVTMDIQLVVNQQEDAVVESEHRFKSDLR
jgi:hypothetical protein